MLYIERRKGENMSYYDEDDFYESSEFDEKMNELKDYLRDSVKQEIQEQIASIQRENENLKIENSNLSSKNKSIECENKVLLSTNKVLKILTDKINEENVYKIIKVLFQYPINVNNVLAYTPRFPQC